MTRHPAADGALSTRQRLIAAGERLIATHGPDGVSMREITAAAGQRNNSAITYHFGGMRGLIDAIWQHHSARVNLERAAMVEQLREQGRLSDLRGLLNAHIVPLANEVGRGRPSYWARFNDVTLSRMPLLFLDAFEDDLAQRVETEVPLHTLSRVFTMMRKQTADGVEPQAGLQVSLMVRFVVTSLAAWERDVEHRRTTPQTLAPLTQGLLSISHRMLAEPVPALGKAG